MDAVLCLVQAVTVGSIALWMVVALRDNLKHSDLNLGAVGLVMRMEYMERDYPEEFAVVAHKRVEDPAAHKRAYRTIVFAETVAATALTASAILLLFAALGAVSAETARVVAALSLCWFSSIWAVFIAGGNFFHYWFSHHSSQMTHFMLMFWGLLTLILIILPAV